MLTEGRLEARARQEFGFEAQVVALMEEAAELTVACARLLNGKASRDAVAEEVVGVSMVARSIRADLLAPDAWERLEKRQRERLALTLQRRQDERLRTVDAGGRR